MTTLMETVEVEVSPRKGGLLGAALPAPDGWPQGLTIPFYGCGEPLLQDYCVTANDVSHGIDAVEFRPFGVSQGASCGTLGRLDQARHAEARLEATTEWAVARQLATNGLSLDTPYLNGGISLGTVAGADFTLAVATLEHAASEAGFGAQWWLHAPVKAASYLEDFIKDGESVAGAPWVISPGYPVPDATTIRLWATGPVWVGVADPYVMQGVDWRANEDTAYANREAIVAFDPCINFYIDVTIPASPTP